PRRRPGHRRRAQGTSARRAAVPRRDGGGYRGPTGLPHRDRAVRRHRTRPDAGISRGVPGPSHAVRCQLYGHRVQRTAPSGAGLRLRASEQASRAAAVDAVALQSVAFISLIMTWRLKSFVTDLSRRGPRAIELTIREGSMPSWRSRRLTASTRRRLSFTL